MAPTKTVEPTDAPTNTPEPTMTVEPTAAATNTPPPTNTQSPTNTAAPTDVPPATASPTSEQSPEVSREQLLGTWWQFDNQAQGNNYIIFREDGSFKGRHGPNLQAGITVSEGTFRLEQDQLTITDNADCPDGEMYQIKFTTKDHLFFKVLGSTCDNFADDFKRQPNWDRLPNAP